MKLGGSEGIITGRCEYLSASPQVQFHCIDANGAPCLNWYDEILVEGLDTAAANSSGD